MLTQNEKNILKFLMTSFNHYSINDISKENKLAPNGAYKILKKLEKLGVAYSTNIGKIKSYKINFKNKLTINYLEIALSDERIHDAKIKIRIQDFKELMAICKAAVIFGSYINEKKKPNDIDIVFVIDKDKYKEYKNILEKIKEIIPYKIHDVIQTPQDVANNLKEQDKIIINAIRNGVVLWGYDIIAGCVKNAQC